MVIGVQMMSSCESDGKLLDQPGGAPRKEGSIWILGENEFCLGQSLLARKASDSQVS